MRRTNFTRDSQDREPGWRFGLAAAGAIVFFFSAVSIFCGAALAQAKADSSRYAGAWEMKLDGRSFLLLTLKAEDGKITGELRRPQHMSVDTNGHFSHIAAPIIVQRIVSATASEERLSFTTQREDDPTDKTDYILSVGSVDKATLRIAALPISIQPWRLGRVRGDACLQVSTDWPQDHSLMQTEDFTSNAELKQMFEDDQKARTDPAGGKIDWSVLNKQDEGRRTAARKMIDAGQLHTAEDFTEAAVLFQHGGKPEDFLMAHTLAVIAIAKGEPASSWIAAASLDRYLHSVQQPQIYGTQFHQENNGPMTQEPFNTVLITDGLRSEMGVPKLADQK